MSRKLISLTLISLIIATVLVLRPTTALSYAGTDCSQLDASDPKSARECLKLQVKDWKEAIESPDINLQSYVNEVFKNLIFTASAFVIHPDVVMADDSQIIDSILNSITRAKAGKIEPVPYAGILNYPALAITSVYTSPPASGIDYTAGVIQKLSPVSAAYAQNRTGFGYQALDTWRFLWRMSRNIAYSVYFIAFLVLGFLIMFKVKISPQVTVTIYNILPRMIILLVMITFSYAIVGFMLDLMYVTAYIGSRVLYQAAGNAYFGNIINGLTPPWDGILQNIINIISRGLSFGATILFHLPFTIGAFIPLMMQYLAVTVFIGLIPILIMPVLLFSWPATIGLGPITGVLGLTLLPLLILISWVVMILIILINIIRIFIALVKAYIGVIIALITGPLQLLAGVFPGSNAPSAWLRGLVANLAVFPTVFFLFQIIAIIGFDALPSLTSSGWSPPLLMFDASFIPNNLIANIFNYGPSQAFGLFARSLLIMGIFFLIPKSADMIKAFFEKKPFPYGAALSEAIKPGKDAAKFAGTAAVGEFQQQVLAPGGVKQPGYEIAELVKGGIQKL